MSIPDIDWWRRRAALWKRALKAYKAKIVDSDRPVLIGTYPPNACAQDVDELLACLGRHTDRAIVVPEGFTIVTTQETSLKEERVLRAAKLWANQGARSHWSTEISTSLWDAVKALEEE